MSKDLVQMAIDNPYADFRLIRSLIDARKEKRIKSYKDRLVLSSLIRMLIFESTHLISDPHKTDNLVEYCDKFVRELNSENLFCFNKIHFVSKGLFTCPVKSFFIFAHNTPITTQDFRCHPLVQILNPIKNKKELG